MARISPLVALPPVIFAGLAAVFLWGMGRDNPNDLPSTMIGREAPAVPQETLPDKTQLSDEMLRQPGVKLVNFWASWCPPCRAEHPRLHALADEGLRVAGVNFKDDAEQANGYLDDAGDPFMGVAFDPKGRSAIDWGVTAPPETFIVDGDGTILFRFAGPLVGSDYEQRFRPELDKALAR